MPFHGLWNGTAGLFSAGTALGTPPPEVGALARALGGGLEPELLFGIGRGTGFGRFKHGPTVTLLTRITTAENEREAFLAVICRRLGVAFRLPVASSEPAVLKRLRGALDDGLLPVLWINPEALPWPSFPSTYHALAVLRDRGRAGARGRWRDAQPAHRQAAGAEQASLETIERAFHLSV